MIVVIEEFFAAFFRRESFDACPDVFGHDSRRIDLIAREREVGRPARADRIVSVIVSDLGESRAEIACGLGEAV